MRKLAITFHSLLALTGLAVFTTVWGFMVFRGSGGFFSPFRSVVIADGRVLQYLLALYSLVGVPATFFCACRAWQLWGGPENGVFSSWMSLRPMSRVFAVLALLLIGIVIAVENPAGTIRHLLGMEETAGDRPGPTEEGLEFPDFPLTDPDPYAWSVFDLDGTEVPMAQFKGKTIFLNAWATWCGYCLVEFPNIQRLVDDMGGRDDLVFLIVSPEEPEVVRKWVKAQEYNLPFYTLQAQNTPEGERPTRFPKAYPVSGLPTTFIIAPDGRTAFSHSGMAAWDGEKTRTFLETLAKTGA